MMISIDRWMCIVHNRQRKLECRDIIVIIIIIWLSACLLATPTFLHRQKQENLIQDSMKEEFYKALFLSNFSNMIPYNFTFENEANDPINISNSFNLENLRNIYATNKNVNLCVENWPDPFYKRIYVLTLFGLEFFLPCLTMLVTYIWIIRFLKKHDQQMIKHEQTKNKIPIERIKSRNHSNCLLLTSLCLAFIVCSLPLSLFNITLDMFFDTNWIQKQELTIYWLIIVLTTLELMNIIVSPILYGYMNQNFRNEFEKINQAIKKKMSYNLENDADIPLNSKFTKEIF